MDNQDELYRVINQKKSEGYLETELAAISRSKLHLGDSYNSRISLMATNSSFSDRISHLFTGEDEEEIVLSCYNLAGNELERYKQDILNDKMFIVANSDRFSYDGIEDNNAMYKGADITHYAAEFGGPKTQFYL